ncbi:MAG: CRISPR-associated endonuclease Cas2 [Candidatus Desulfofervidaceae bacterium]|nr:CRISPR-associated endonuclease Cas2 [Candidatus Desulfofervidaceae bacterium]MDL1971536.1 CRISPR-associated endonuclease Cas2 [Candidatus Desulfofervidaceae bacterium]
MKEKQFIVVSYDIADERRLQKVAKVMKDYGFRVLYSVFECYIERDLFEKMKARVEKIIDPLEDSVIYYFLCEHCRSQIEHIGKTPFYLKEETVAVV